MSIWRMTSWSKLKPGINQILEHKRMWVLVSCVLLISLMPRCCFLRWVREVPCGAVYSPRFCISNVCLTTKADSLLLASHINWIKLTPKHLFCVSTFASLETFPLCAYLSAGGKGSTGCLHFHLALYFLRLGVLCHWSSSLSVVVSLQVHKLEPEVWKSVEAIYIDIADRSQVLPKVW